MTPLQLHGARVHAGVSAARSTPLMPNAEARRRQPRLEIGPYDRTGEPARALLEATAEKLRRRMPRAAA